MKKPSYRRHSIRNKGFAEFNGKRKYFPGDYESDKSKAGYKQFLAENGFKVDADLPEPEKICVSRVCSSFLKWASEYFGAGGDTRLHVYTAAVKQVDEYRNDKAVEFGPKKLVAIQHRMASEGYKRNYVNEITGHIRYVFKWAVKEELVPADVYFRLKSVPGLVRGKSKAVESMRRPPVAWEHVEPVIKLVRPIVADMLRFHWLVAFRSKSICRALPEEFTITNGLWEWRPTHKTEWRGCEVVLFIGPQCQELLRPILAKTKPGERLFPGYHTRNYCQQVTRAIEKINREREKRSEPLIPLWTPHRLRHSRSQTVRDQFGIEACQAFLAHESLTATQIYSARRLEMARAVAAEIG